MGDKFGVGHCPKCGVEMLCPCSACNFKREQDKYVFRSKNTDHGVLWEWPDGHTIKCGSCGLTRNAGWWEDLDWKRHKKGLLNERT